MVPVQLQELDCLSSVRIYIPKDLRPPDARQMALKVCDSYSSNRSLSTWQLDNRALIRCAACHDAWHRAAEFDNFDHWRMMKIPCMHAGGG